METHKPNVTNLGRLFSFLAQAYAVGICPDLHMLDNLIAKLREMSEPEMEEWSGRIMEKASLEMETEAEFSDFLKQVELMLGV